MKAKSYLYIKHLFDFLAALTALILLSPILFALSLLVLLFHGKPVIFTQQRPGRHERIFRMYKFRTMTNETDSSGNPLPDHIRLTRFGKFLRKTSLDELPEFFNVIKGDMSLVGPRPLLISYLTYYTERENTRHMVRPGITGLAQVSGRNSVDWTARLELDAQYVEKISFWLDVKILWLTIGAVFLSKGVSVDSSAIEPSLIDYRKKTK